MAIKVEKDAQGDISIEGPGPDRPESPIQMLYLTPEEARQLLSELGKALGLMSPGSIVLGPKKEDTE